MGPLGTAGMSDLAADSIRDSIETKTKLLDPGMLSKIAEAAAVCIRSLESGGKILLFGNGGSNTDAQHIAGEIVCRMRVDRVALPAMSLGLSTNSLTAIGNDLGFDCVFSREVEAFAREGDVAIGISTSGNSPNVLNGMREAAKRNVKTIALTGRGGGPLAGLAEIALIVPCSDTARIQESHIAIGHVIADLIERHFVTSREFHE